MATSELLLELANRVDPASNAPGSTTAASAAAATTNAHQLRFFTLDFDKDTDESTAWQFSFPANYLSGGTVYLKWFSTPTSGNVVWKASIYVATDGSSDLDTSSAYNAVDTATTAAPGTSGFLTSTSIALTSPGIAANKYCNLMVGRDANNGSDTAAGDARLLAVKFQWTS